MDISNLVIAPDSRGSVSPASGYNTSGFWERLWRTSGLHFVIFAMIAYAIYVYHSPAGSPTEALVAFREGIAREL